MTVIFHCFDNIQYFVCLMDLAFHETKGKIGLSSISTSFDNQQTLIELIYGMQEIKLQGSEKKRRWKWIDVQALLFRVQTNSLKLKQYQDFGALFLNRLKDVLISYLAAKSVISGNITLGTLVSIQYIVGQLNIPLDNILNFFRSSQDARISLTRMAEVTDVTPEEDPQVQTISEIPGEAAISLDKVGFAYSPLSRKVLGHRSHYPCGKVTAIVGASGSGKTTLLCYCWVSIHLLKAKCLWAASHYLQSINLPGGPNVGP
ncbi:MAG: hypothetical protein IPN89_14980 [Saprospiraceae bacterium]|nr:hypothetical protein [Saprospiraceae bacterium]